MSGWRSVVVDWRFVLYRICETGIELFRTGVPLGGIGVLWQNPYITKGNLVNIKTKAGLTLYPDDIFDVNVFWSDRVLNTLQRAA